MRKTIWAASLAISFATGTASAAPPPSPMTPSAPWNVEFADSMCVLSRPYGADGATNLAFKPGMVGNAMEIIVLKTTTSIENNRSGEAVLAVAGKTADVDARFTAYNTKTMRLLRVSLGDDKLALSTVNGTLLIDAVAEGRHLFSVTGIARALPVLADCLAQLRTAYNVSDAEMAAIVTPPKGSALRYFSTNDYPDEAVRKEQFGTVGVLLWVETTGRVSTCTIIESSAADTLKEATCNILKRRARFEPARDVQEKPIRAPIFTRIRWELPG